MVNNTKSSEPKNNSGGNKDEGTGTPDVPPFLIAKPSALDSPIATNPNKRTVSLGWSPDIPDQRDRVVTNKMIVDELKLNNSPLLDNIRLPPHVDNRSFCSPIEDQGALGSCTAQAVVGLMEYLMRRGGIKHIDGSKLFVYKVTRKLLGWTGDTGAYLRSTIKAVSAFGVPPEKHWPYIIENYEIEPDAFLYSFASNFKSLNYTRLDSYDLTSPQILDSVKRVLHLGYGAVFGFSVYSSLTNAADIPFPTESDSLSGGHAVMAVGYDDNHINENGVKVPSIIIRNSWGTSWGDGGYGYLPYEYLHAGLMRDIWTCFKWDWINTNTFN